MRDDLQQRLRGVFALERRATGDEGVESGAQRINVARRADMDTVAERLFRGYLAGGAQDWARMGHLGVQVSPFGEAEIGDARFVLFVDQNVVRLDVAVQHALAVRVGNGVGNGPAWPAKRRALSTRRSFFSWLANSGIKSGNCAMTAWSSSLFPAYSRCRHCSTIRFSRFVRASDDDSVICNSYDRRGLEMDTQPS